jgi:hypothetical protein
MYEIDSVLRNVLRTGGIRAAEENEPSAEEKIAAAEAKVAEALSKAEAAQKQLDEQKFTVTVDGKEQTLTREEAIAALSKVEGADKKFREASDLRKQAERGMKIDSLIARLKDADDPDQKDINELSGLLGVDPSLFQADDPSGKGGKDKPPQKIRLEDLDDNLKAQLEFEAQRSIEAAEAKILEDIKKKVDKDQILGKMNNVAKESGNELFLDAAADMVHEDVLRKIRSGEPFGPVMIDNSIQAARNRLKKFGTPEEAAKTKTIIMGLGQPGGEPMKIQTDEPIERVDSSEPNYADNFATRAFQMLAKGSAGSKA